MTEQTTTTTTATSLDEQTQITPLDEQLQEKRAQLTQAQITQTNEYSDYIKVMKAKTIVDEKDSEKVAKLDKLMFNHFISYQYSLEEAQKLRVEISNLESKQYIEELLG